MVKTATYRPFVRLLVADNDRAKTRKYDSGYKNCLRKGAADRTGIVMREDGIIHGSTLNISAVGCLLVHSRSKTS